MGRKLRFFGIPLAAAVLAVFGLQGSAYAAPSPNSVQIPAFLRTTGFPHPTIVASLVPQLDVGNCSVIGNHQSFVEVDLTTGALLLIGQTRTTHSADVLHSDLTFYASNGTQVLSAGGSQLDSVPMGLINQDYGWSRTMQFAQLPPSMATVTSVVWTGHC